MDISELISLSSDQQHEYSFRRLADWLPQLIWTCTPQGECDYLSRRWEDFTGVPSALQLGAAWLEQVHPEDRPRLSVAWQQSITNATPLRIDFRVRRYDGVYHWFDTRAQPVRDGNGEVIKWFGSNTDIQETIDVREELLLSEQRFRGLYHSAPVSIWLEDWSTVLTDLQHLRSNGVEDFSAFFMAHPEVVDRMLDAVQVRDVNDWSLSVFRADRKEQLLGSLRWLFATAAARAGFIRKLEGIARGERALHIEMEMNAIDGQCLHVLTGIVLPSPQSDQGLVMVSRIDITEHYRAGEQLRQQQMLLGRMSNLAKVGGWQFDVATMVGTWTDEVARIHDLESGQPLVVAEALRCYHGESRLRVEAAIRDAVEQGKPYDLELPMVSVKHVHKWVRTLGVPVFDQGRVVRLEGALQDITERKQAELAVQALNTSLESQVLERTAQLERAHHDLQSILDALPTMVAYWDRDYRNQFANRAYFEFFGLDRDQIHGKHFREVFGDKVFEERLPELNYSMEGHIQEFEQMVVLRDGPRSRRMQIYYRPDVVDDVVQGLYVLFFDVTDLKNAEEGLRAANRELEAFAYAVAHDLRAPLRALSGFSNALLEDCASSMNEETRDFAVEIHKASQRMGELLEGLLALSRSTQGKMQRDYVDLSEMACKLCAELQSLNSSRTVQWRVSPGMSAFGDARMLELVLRNLLGNAWKYTAKMAAPQVAFDRVAQDGQVYFCVSDNGAGFDMAHADRLFKPFQRLHRQDEFPGIGIGLATVQRIVHRHGGEIFARAERGAGARFCFSLGEQLPGEINDQDVATG